MLVPWKKSYDKPQFSSVAQSCLTLCDSMNRSTPCLPVHHQLPQFTHTHVHQVSDAMTNLDSTLKNRDIIFPAKVHIVKAMVFPVVMYGCESWTVKKAEHQRIDAFKLWCWWRLLRVPLKARRSNQSIGKEINLEYSLERLMLKLKLKLKLQFLACWCKELTHWKTLNLRKTESSRGQQKTFGWFNQLNKWVD